MTNRIEINFPVDVEISEANYRRLDKVLRHICDDYEKTHPDRVMWPFGMGDKMLVNPLMLGDDEPIPFDGNVYAVEIAEREVNKDENGNVIERGFRLRHTSYDAEEMFHDIADFHRKFGLEYKGPPRRLPEELGEFRTGFIAEELAEYVSPKGAHHMRVVEMIKTYYRDYGDSVDLEKQFDALIDMVYVAMGTAYLQGFAFDEGWRRVHEANMKKVRALRAEDSARNSTHDVVKPAGWTPPDLSDLVKA